MDDQKVAIEMIRKSELFDAKWYVETYADFTLADADPAEHYFEVGHLLLRDPSVKFSTADYLKAHPDVAKSRINPLYHYLKCRKDQKPEVDVQKGVDLKENQDSSDASNKESDELSANADSRPFLGQLRKTLESKFSKQKTPSHLDSEVARSSADLGKSQSSLGASNKENDGLSANTKADSKLFLEQLRKTLKSKSQQSTPSHTAEELLEAAEKESGEYPWLYDHKAHCYWALNKFDLALAAWEKAITLASKSNSSLAQQIEGTVKELRERKSDEISSELRNLVRYVTNDAESKLQEHLGHLEQVALNVQSHKNQMVGLADWYLENDKKKFALIVWEWLAENSAETSEELVLQAAGVGRELGLYERSMQILSKALVKIPNNPWLYDGQAHCFMDTYQYEEAINSWRKAVEISESKEQKEKFVSIKKERFAAVKSDLQQLKNEKEKLFEENSTLKADIQTHKRNIEDRFRELATLTGMLEEQRKELEACPLEQGKSTTNHLQGNELAEKFQKVENELLEAKQENELLLLQLHQVQEELELLYLSQNKMEDK